MTTLVRNNIQGRAVPIPGEAVDTDRIVPARFLKEITFDRMGEYLFYDVRFDASGAKKDHPLNDAKFAGSEIMVVGSNFGCGSSREHAPQAILRAGFKAVIGESFAEIFAGNCKALGIPTVTTSRENIHALMTFITENPSEIVTLDLDKKWVRAGTLSVAIDLPESRRQSFLAGTWNELAVLKANMSQIQKTAEKLPYWHV